MEEENTNDDGGGDSWLVSYADMMTLIACFFILMMAFANYDPAGFNKKAEELSKSFNKGEWKSSDIELEALNEEIARHPTLKKMTKITMSDGELVITFSGSVLFDEAQLNLSKESMSSIDVLVDIIRSKDTNYQIIVEGHSDPVEYKKIDNHSAWSLSAIRAAKVLERFEFMGFSPKNLVALAKGEFSPIIENYDDNGKILEQNTKLNRRVVIKVAKNKDNTKKLKLGLGVYVDE